MVFSLLIVMVVCPLEQSLQHVKKQGSQDQVHVSPGMLYNEEKRECLMSKVDKN